MNFRRIFFRFMFLFGGGGAGYGARGRKVPAFLPILAVCVYFFYRYVQIPGEFYEYFQLLDRSKNQSCFLQKLNPFDPSILQFISKAPPNLNCKKLQPQLTFFDAENFLVLNFSALSEARLPKETKCSFRCVEHNSGNSDDIVKNSDWVPLEKSAKPDCEFVEVQCWKPFLNVNVYRYIWAKIIPKPIKPKISENQRKLGVVILGKYSISLGYPEVRVGFWASI